ncbi:MAG: radical SAM protein [Nitrospinae bacterium]|nr:radical SAM protein [Nitrospinota bacterium]
MPGRYLNLTPCELDARAESAYAIYRECRVCPRACAVDRTRGETGFCRQSDRLTVSSFVRHFGEEIPLTGTRGVGNIFVSSCNMRCDYCQNYQISQDRLGAEYDYSAVADEMLKLQSLGVHYIGWVSPSHVAPGLLKSLAIARRKGLTLPIVYNTNGYDAVPTLRLLDGIVDIYLPDLKYASSAVAREYSHVRDYAGRSRDAVLEMFRQVGPLTLDGAGMAVSGVMVRHLVLPGGLAGTWETLCFVALEMSPKIPLSLMSQYRPVHKALADPRISRMITESEYAEALRMAEELGFETLFVQRLDDALHNLPDFTSRDNPFPLDRAHNGPMEKGQDAVSAPASV